MKWLLWAGAAGAVAYVLFPTQVAMLVGGLLQRAQSLGPAPQPTGHPYTIPGMMVQVHPTAPPIMLEFTPYQDSKGTWISSPTQVPDWSNTHN